MSDKLHKLEEAMSKKDLGKMRQMIKTIDLRLDTDQFDAEKMFSKLTKKEFAKLREWPSLILKASYITAKEVEEHLALPEVEFWKMMYKQCLTLYLICRQSRSTAAAVEAITVTIKCAMQYRSLGGSMDDLDSSSVFKKGWQSDSIETMEGGIELD